MIINHQREKLVEAVRYFAFNVQKLGKVKLFKLLYFLDFEHYRDTGRSVTGLDYFAWKMGPVPVSLYEELELPRSDWDGKVSFDKIPLSKAGKEMLAVRAFGAFDDRYFSKRELRLMEKLASEYKSTAANEMVEATHLENLPWDQVFVKQGNKQAVIPFSMALRRQEADQMASLIDERNQLMKAFRD